MKARPTPLLPTLRRFFEVHLKAELGVSQNTQRAYRDAWRLFLRWLVETAGLGRTDVLTLQDVSRKNILDFLHHLEEVRGVTARTRNQRLAAFRSFARYVSGEQTAWGDHFRRILRIPAKRHRRNVVDYLEPDELHCLLSQVRQGLENALRDFTLLVFAYNTGARAHEIAQTRLSWLQLEHPPFQVRLHGKGGRPHVVPLWPATVELVQRYLRNERKRPREGAETFLFLNRRGQALTRFGVSKLFRRYLTQARKHMPTLRHKRLSIHSMRHTTAVHLLQHGLEPNAIKAWLGHASIQSTDVYMEVNLDTKRSTLEQFVTPYYVTDFLNQPDPPSDQGVDWLNHI